MTVLRRILFAGLFAGLLAGLAVTAAQQVRVVPLILAAEVYESAGNAAAPHTHATHAESMSNQTMGAPHDHDHGGLGHDDAHSHDGWAPEDGLERTAFTLLANLVTGVAYGFLLVAAMVFAGRSLNWRRGVLWGAAGFAAIALAPAMGLPPELPGMMAADLGARQAWWIGTALASVAGLALIILAPATRAGRAWQRPVLQALGLVALVLPHVIGAPHGAGDNGPVPAELAAQFAIASLVAQAVFWAVLGVAAGHLMGRVQTSQDRIPAAASAS